MLELTCFSGFPFELCGLKLLLSISSLKSFIINTAPLCVFGWFLLQWLLVTLSARCWRCYASGKSTNRQTNGDFVHLPLSKYWHSSAYKRARSPAPFLLEPLLVRRFGCISVLVIPSNKNPPGSFNLNTSLHENTSGVCSLCTWILLLVFCNCFGH